MSTLDARLLRELRASAVHLPVGDLAATLAVSREEIAAAIARLRGAGFDFEEKPGLGCRLLASPDRLLADDLFARLGGGSPENPLAREILVFEETASTNEVAARLGREGHAGGLLIFAEHQTAGRGRFGRRWESAPRAGLWFSLLLRPEFPPQFWPRLTTWAGVAVAAAIESATGLRPQIKWPNDVLLGGKKIAGILTECFTDRTRGMFAVTGIGVNVNQPGMPDALAERAASLRQLTGRALDRGALGAAIVTALAARLRDLPHAFGKLVAEAAARSSILGKWIRLEAADRTFQGRAENLDPEGNLLLRLADGTLRTMSAGEVTSQPGPPREKVPSTVPPAD